MIYRPEISNIKSCLFLNTNSKNLKPRGNDKPWESLNIYFAKFSG